MFLTSLGMVALALSTGQHGEEPKPRSENDAPELVGIWVREVPGPMRLSLRVTDNRMYGRAEIAIEKAGVLSFDFDADYAVNQESMAFGVITSVEFPLDKLEGITPVLTAEHTATFRGLFDAPFRFRFRVDGDTLTVKSIRIAAGDAIDAGGLKQLQSVFGGQYRHVDQLTDYKPENPARIIQTPVGGMTLPSGRYLDHPPRYFPQDPEFPLERELATMEAQADLVPPQSVPTPEQGDPKK